MGHARKKYLRAGIGGLAGIAAVIAMVPGPSAAQITPPRDLGPDRARRARTAHHHDRGRRADHQQGRLRERLDAAGRRPACDRDPGTRQLHVDVAKKPYKIKLAEDAALLGTEPRDEWVLLANYADRTALRTTWP